MTEPHVAERTEEERFLGLTTLQVAKVIVEDTPRVHRVFLRAYSYVPDKPSGDDEVHLSLSREEFLSGDTVERFTEEFSDEWNIALDSSVEFADGTRGHFPMLDLAPRQSEEALERIRRRMQEILVPHYGGGVLLATRKSYHYLGTRVFNEDRFQDFLGRALITSIVTKTPDDVPNEHDIIADYRYIGHALIRGTTGLRITAKGTKTVLPKVVASV